jgi:hypothetical protein
VQNYYLGATGNYWELLSGLQRAVANVQFFIFSLSAGPVPAYSHKSIIDVFDLCSIAF